MSLWEAYEICESRDDVSITATLVLDFDARQKSRLRATTACGQTVGIFLPRGTGLADQDVLVTTDGKFLRVQAALEKLSEVVCDDLWMLARAAYHLGNRHVPLQVLPGILRYQTDYVLDDMVRQLGLSVIAVEAPFQPEKGAYHGQGGHSHAHGQAGSVWKLPEISL